MNVQKTAGTGLVLVTLIFVANTTVSWAQDINPTPQLENAPSASVQGKTVLNALVKSSVNYMLPTLGNNVPDYLKGVEFNVNLQDNLKPEWSVLTVQPLHQSADKKHTFFTQLSQRNYDYLGTNRNVTNVGFGYRRLLAGNTILTGVNTFFDYEWKRGHKRVGLGAEVKWSGLDFTANYYKGLGKKSGRGLSGDTQEEILDGRDFELSAQVPYLPWAKVHASTYYWNSVANADNINGWSTSIEAKVHQNITIEAGVKDDNFTPNNENFIQVSFSVPLNDSRPVMASNMMVSNNAWDMRDMTNYTLDKVRRQNKIILERTTSGVVITRGN